MLSKTLIVEYTIRHTRGIQQKIGEMPSTVVMVVDVSYKKQVFYDGKLCTTYYECVTIDLRIRIFLVI